MRLACLRTKIEPLVAAQPFPVPDEEEGLKAPDLEDLCPALHAILGAWSGEA